MKTINDFIFEKLTLNNQSTIAKKSPEAIVKKNSKLIMSYLDAEPSKKSDLSFKKWEFIDKSKADDYMYEFEAHSGYGWYATTGTDVSNKDKEKMLDLLSKNGGWYFIYSRKSGYDKYWNKFIIALNDDYTKVTMLRGYGGCWTMSGEDYVSGRSQIIEIDLK